MRGLYIFGAGGFGREVAWLVERINDACPTWDLKGFIVDDEQEWGSNIVGYPVLGGCDFLGGVGDDAWTVCAVGSASAREEIVARLSALPNVRFATLVDPSAIMSARVSIGEGSIICAGTIITVDVEIGRHVIVNLDCTIGHDDRLEDYVTAYPSVNVSGTVSVGRCAELGTGSQIIQGKTVGKRAIVGAGAVVVRDIPPRCVAVGSPAKPIRFFE